MTKSTILALIALCLLVLSACVVAICTKLTASDNSHIKGTSDSKPTITYFKDTRTNLCYSNIMMGYQNKTTICVPCDSLKNIKLD
jgi:hypothetical protein